MMMLAYAGAYGCAGCLTLLWFNKNIFSLQGGHFWVLFLGGMLWPLIVLGYLGYQIAKISITILYHIFKHF